MRKLFLLLSIVFASLVLINAQSAPQTDKEKEERQRQEAIFNQRVDNLRNIDKPLTRRDPNRNFQVYQSKIKPLYRKPTLEEQKLLAPDREVLQAFADVLNDKTTDLIRLIADKGCSKDLGIIVSTPHCLKYTMPGAGASYSFRLGNHWLKHLGDLNFGGENLQSSQGVLTNAIMVNIGDVPLNKISPEHKALKTLMEFQPVSDFKQAAKLASLLEKGIRDSDFVYANKLPARENSTYLLRSIAYRGESLRSIEEIVYDEFEFDKRKDVIIAFRVIRFNPNESVTILWKELNRKDSPKIKK